MNTSHITDTLSESIPETVTGRIADVGALFDTVPGTVADSVGAGVTTGRRFARRAAKRVPDFDVPDFHVPDFHVPDFHVPDFDVPGLPGNNSADRRWWLAAALLGVAAVLGIVWYSRRSSANTDDAEATVADIDTRRSIA